VSAARNSDHETTEAVVFDIEIVSKLFFKAASHNWCGDFWKVSSEAVKIT
jgi:hypothetical protein